MLILLYKLMEKEILIKVEKNLSEKALLENVKKDNKISDILKIKVFLNI